MIIVRFVFPSIALVSGKENSFLEVVIHARDISRFLGVIQCLALPGIAFGTGTLFLDIAAGMPDYWIPGEGPLVTPLGIALFWLARRVKKTGRPYPKRNG